jgi:hypothetical protein
MRGVRSWPRLTSLIWAITKVKIPFYTVHSAYSPPPTRHICNRRTHSWKMVCRKSAENPPRIARTTIKRSSIDENVALQTPVSWHRKERSHVVLNLDSKADDPFFWIHNSPNSLGPPQCSEPAQCQNAAWFYFRVPPALWIKAFGQTAQHTFYEVCAIHLLSAGRMGILYRPMPFKKMAESIVHTTGGCPQDVHGCPNGHRNIWSEVGNWSPEIWNH